ncbi:Ger(x)C family spore germination protein [Tumebacillus sp. ITR2]|uniref:Ger(X)C family spore germination protein n=1 Tax=Tumebacillus amylolyticus TaxID=2801339 RepID=A0ABS1J4X0_9BACL|nr:Ger(x)C family spore germination protein [Tumebacillus amylolyticus]MBL0385314.1 Ger(x)C family spore germination protein [Tumebacillus amylolyticus]
MSSSKKKTLGNSSRLLLILILSTLPFSFGCWDRTEINDIAIVVSTAFDLDPDGKYRVTCQMALPGQMGGSNGGGGGTSGQKSYYVDSETGNTIREANARQQARLSRQLFFAHRRVLIIGEELAKQGIREIFDVVARVPENRLTSNIVIAKGKGYDLLNAQPQFERFSAEAMREILQSDNMIEINMKDVAQELSQVGTDPLIPLMMPVQTTKGKQKSTETQFIGYAQFHDDRYVGPIQDEAAQGIYWIRQRFKPYTTSFENKQFGKIAINVYKGKSEVIPHLGSDHITFDVRINANCYITEAEQGIDFGMSENIQKVEGVFDQKIKQSVQAAIAEIKNHKSDSGQLGLVIARNYPRQWQDKYEKHWYAELQKAEFKISVNTEVARVGLISENIAKKEVTE